MEPFCTPATVTSLTLSQLYSRDWLGRASPKWSILCRVGWGNFGVLTATQIVALGLWRWTNGLDICSTIYCSIICTVNSTLQSLKWQQGFHAEKSLVEVKARSRDHMASWNIEDSENEIPKGSSGKVWELHGIGTPSPPIRLGIWVAPWAPQRDPE